MSTAKRKETLFSGIQPSGTVHVGNYLGAIRNWARLLDDYDCIFCIVDYHAITVDYDAALLGRRIFEGAAINIAAGLDPGRCRLFVQSHVPEHTELAWMFNTVTPMGALARMTQFKEKSRRNEDNINVGLFDYPVLQAADILIYKASAVPVGEDQIQHLELAREIARKFNNRFGEIFPECKPLLSPTPRIMGLDGEAKMSKSLNNYIGLDEDADSIWTKLAPAKTDEARKRRSDPGNPDVCNIFTLHKGFSTDAEIAHIDTECRSAGIGCVDCKRILHKNMAETLAPIQSKFQHLVSHPDEVHDILNDAGKRCREQAVETMDEVRAAMGLREAAGRRP